MSDTIIRVENLAKKYVLRHQQEAHYVALRDVIAKGARSLMHRLRRHQPQTSVPTREEFWALKDVSFEVRQGDRVGIIGRNGAGKSTLLKLLSRITEPTQGRIAIRGRVASLLEVGTGFHSELTGRENIFLNGAVLGMTNREIQRKFDQIVAFAEVEKFLDTPVKHYSSGMYMRLAFSVAAHLEPEILIVDEVLAVGDAEFQKKCLGKMEDVARNEGRTVLFVSHNMTAVNRLCQSGIWLDQGQIKTAGPVEQTVAAYLTAGIDAMGERTWNPPQGRNQKMRLKAIRVCTAAGEKTAMIDARSPFYVEIEYQVLMPLREARVGFFLQNTDGVIVFAPNDQENDDFQAGVRQPGVYISRCQIPAQLLNTGSYYLTPSADIPAIESLFYEECAVQFQIERLAGAYSNRPDQLPGVICPPLKWQVLSI